MTANPSLQRGVVFAGILLLSGCSGDMSDLQRFVEQTKLQQRGTVQPLPEFQPYESFVYSEEGLRDPFIEAELEQTNDAPSVESASGLRPDTNRRREPLENFPLDSLQMVGILEQNEITWGLVQAPDGTIHRVLAGNYAGQNYGEITRITEERISVYEIIPDGVGGWVEREASLALGEE